MIEIKTFENGLEYIEISNSSADARIAMQGAHLFHYRRGNEPPLLWPSPDSLFEPGKAIRGGIPVCWPWFGPHPSDNALPQHGFARTSTWKLHETHEIGEGTSTITMRLHDSPETRKLWPFRFRLTLHVTVSRSLTVNLVTSNLDEEPFEISSALHSYLSVSDIRRTTIEGLDGRRYFDKVTGSPGFQKGRLHIDRETDRIYQEVQYPLTVRNEEQTVNIHARGSASAVVWNPWHDKCSVMTDMPDDGWKTMLCIEAANVMDDARVIEPGGEHTLTAAIS